MNQEKTTQNDDIMSDNNIFAFDLETFDLDKADWECNLDSLDEEETKQKEEEKQKQYEWFVRTRNNARKFLKRYPHFSVPGNLTTDDSIAFQGYLRAKANTCCNWQYEEPKFSFLYIIS